MSQELSSIKKLLLFLQLTSTIQQSNARSSIPRSNNSRGPPFSSSNLSTSSSLTQRLPPWNLSSRIDPNGFFTETYSRIPGEWEQDLDENTQTATESNSLRQNDAYNSLSEPVVVRQVPGDGNCLFHSLTVALAVMQNRTHLDLAHTGLSSSSVDPSTPNERSCLGLEHLYAHSRRLRHEAVQVLQQNRRLLFLQGNEYLKARDLVQAAAAQYGLTGKEYCDLMRRDSYWGGGPEIVALCNYLRRPIHVYELTEHMEDEKDLIENENAHPTNEKTELKVKANETKIESDCFRLRRMACFGSPKFDRQPALHILSADSRFPDISPGQQLASGNHFLAIIPESIMRSIERDEEGRKRKRNIKKGASIRGGGDHPMNKRRRRRKQQREFVRSDLNGDLTVKKEINSRLSKDYRIEEGSFFSHKIFKLVNPRRSERIQPGSDYISKRDSAQKSVAGRENISWEWLINKCIDCILKFINKF